MSWSLFGDILNARSLTIYFTLKYLILRFLFRMIARGKILFFIFVGLSVVVSMRRPPRPGVYPHIVSPYCIPCHYDIIAYDYARSRKLPQITGFTLGALTARATKSWPQM